MQRTKIEWCDYSWNPVKGLCPQNCKLPDGTSYCYARAMYKRFEWDPKVRLDEPELYDPPPLQSKRIFVGSTIDLFHSKIPDEWIQSIINLITNGYYHQKHTFIFLTKNPARYAEFDFPKNCWLGVTVTRDEEVISKIGHLYKKDGHKVFISVEPLLGPIESTSFYGIDWIIIGALTGPKAKYYTPKCEWIQNIVDLKKTSKVSIFLKDNLAPVWGDKLIQEFPKS